MCILAAETVEVRILRGESRSVGDPRSILHGVKSPWLLEQPEWQNPRERAWMALPAGQGIEGTAWHYGHSITGAAEHPGYSMMSATLLSSASLRKLTDNSKEEKLVEREYSTFCQLFYYFFIINYFNLQMT